MSFVTGIINAVISVVPKVLEVGCQIIGYTKEGVTEVTNVLGGISGTIFF